MNKPKPATVDPDDLSEVAAFMRAQERLENWKKTYAGAFQELMEIAELHNSTLEAADKSVRAREVSSGPFELLNYSTTFNANALYDALGREDFLRFGGSVQTVQQYDIDKKQFEAFVAQKKIHPDVVKAVISYGPRYKKLDKVIIP
jgi:hypothetical protein